MMKAAFFALAVASAALAAPAVELGRRCGGGAPEQWIQDEVYNICVGRGLAYKLILATFETAQVESGWHNLDCGDQDSVGVFQQRPSMGWCPNGPQDCENVSHATNAFIDALISCDQAHPSEAAGTLAQCVQGSEFPDRYNEEESTAASELAAAISRNGGGGGDGAANVEGAPSKKPTSTKKTSTSTKKASTPTSTSSSGKAVKAPGNVASGTIKSGCKKYYTVAHGNTCNFIDHKFGISLSTFRSINKGVHSSCNNLQVGKAYCVKH